MFDLGGGELLLILVDVLILFGPKKLPELAQGLGKGLRQFRKAQQDFSDQINTAFYEDQRKENTRKAPAAAQHTIARNAQSTSLPSSENTAEPGDEGSGTDSPKLSGIEDAPLKGVEPREPQNSIAPPDRLPEEEHKGKGEEPAS